MISITQDEIDITNPATLLTHDILSGKVAGNTVMLAKPQALEDKTGLLDALRQTLLYHHTPEKLEAEAQSKLQGLSDDIKSQLTPIYLNIITGVLYQAITSATAGASTEPKALIRHDLCFITLPDQNHTPERTLQQMTNNCLTTTPPLLMDNEPYRYSTTCHELAHSWGCNEEQADMAAAILSRRAYGSCATVNLMADLRAVESVWSAYLTDKLKPIPAYRKIRREHHNEYGWKVAEANDHVAAMSVDAVESMSLSDIFECRAQSFAHDIKTTLKLGTMLSEIAGPPQKESLTLERFVTDAAELEQRAIQSSRSSILHAKAARYALATRRLATGASAYQ